MKKTVIIEFEEKDYEILKKHLNDASEPCIKCSSAERMQCCGCPDHRKWKDNHAEVEEAELTDILSKLQEYFQLAKQVQELQQKMERQEKEFVEIGIDLNRLSEKTINESQIPGWNFTNIKEISLFLEKMENVLKEINAQLVYTSDKIYSKNLTNGIRFHIITPDSNSLQVKERLKRFFANTQHTFILHNKADRNLDMDYYCIWNRLYGGWNADYIML